MHDDQVLDQIGPRLRAARVKQDRTLQEVAASAGISASTLSRLESGHRRPNLELLLPVARQLHVGLDELVPTAVPDPRVRLGSRREGGVTVLPLSPETAPVQVIKMTVPPSRAEVVPRTHDGYDWVYVLAGELRLVLGNHDVTMGPGESAGFDCRTPHWMGAAGRRPVELLCMFNREGERIHLGSDAAQES